MRYYINTCIYIDYLQNRSDRFRPLGEWALELLNKIKERGHLIVISDVVIEELGNHVSEKEQEELLTTFPFVHVSLSKKQFIESLRLRKNMICRSMISVMC